MNTLCWLWTLHWSGKKEGWLPLGTAVPKLTLFSVHICLPTQTLMLQCQGPIELSGSLGLEGFLCSLSSRHTMSALPDGTQHFYLEFAPSWVPILFSRPGLANFSSKGPETKYLRFGRSPLHLPCCYSRKVATDNMLNRKCGWAPIWLHLQKQTITE